MLVNDVVETIGRVVESAGIEIIGVGATIATARYLLSSLPRPAARGNYRR